MSDSAGQLAPDAGAPTVVVVTPAFRAARWIEGAMRTVAAQREGGAVRVVHLVLDGSPDDDGTAEIVARYSHPDTHYERRPDRGPADAINRGFAAARGEFLAWLNADDLYAPGALVRAVAALRAAPRAAFAFGRCPVVDAEGREIRRFVTRFKEFWFPLSCRSAIRTLNYISQPATLIRRSAWEAAGGALRTDLRAAWDYELWLRLWARGGAVRVKGAAPMAFFRWTPGSISGSGWERQFAEELAVARADAGRFAPESLLHWFVARGIVFCYRRMNAVRQ